jgi:hypothetical protein
MFTWICPQCGREVPPAYNECPDCTGKQAGATAPPQQAQPQGPAAIVMTAPPQQAAQPAERWPRAIPPEPKGIAVPPWLMSIVFAILFVALGTGAYFGIKYFSGSGEAATGGPPAALQKASSSAGANAKASALQKYVEVVGLRLTEEPNKKPQVRFVVVNHSGAEIADLAANVNLWARTAKSDEETVGTFSFKIPSLGPYETKEMSGLLTTKLRVYELPDWQNLVPDVQITSPQ